MTSDGESFDSYVAAEGAALLRFAHVLTGDHHLAEDLVQEALVKAHRRWNRVDRPGAYVKKAVLRQYLSWRRCRSSGERPTDVSLEGKSTQADVAEQVTDRHALRALLATLPRQQRAVLVLRFFEDLDDATIADLIGCSTTTVRAHASKGLSRLRQSAQTVVAE
ncbi:SigE family RNA polymerase sigma factor [Cryptosporangium sp. NPDC048952]|uniref:SigE family RNA polymerase sigma factor n=1 Tax=Cryptosporangium sp. NPDC048952 TaxID=3363961 RepID=UPI003716F858